ncbi:MAG: tRNA preQ1(34) S-adenosylmethionine ribosyltransferase-isomerase QueA [Deltaproteobacteria bacterium]|nr:tRNA preQ1(34) S-adenosylmethionine ribosyltransferase-isomerase QueA [Deltaproteobacteria bacterium]
MLTRHFDFHLPQESIAQEPSPRGQSRLLHLDAEGPQRHRRVSDLPFLLRAGDLVVVNDTRVIPARLFAKREDTGGRIEVLLVEREDDLHWQALLKPGKKARQGRRFVLEGGDAPGTTSVSFQAEESLEDGRYRLRFSTPVDPHLDRLGHIPLPPYIKRPDDERDRQRYQTVFANQPGAIAAPTAGLHFTEEILDRLVIEGVGLTTVTLHVGIGTFKPVTAELAHEHRMDRERFHISAEAAEKIRSTRAKRGRIVAIGTTVVRTLETAALEGDGEVRCGPGSSELFIRPGFSFRAVDLLVTNFHLPRSTLLMLVSAFAGRERTLAAYREAVDKGYRFYSYGDAMLVERT